MPDTREIRQKGGPSADFARTFQESISATRTLRATTLSPTKQIPTAGIKSPQKAATAATLLPQNIPRKQGKQREGKRKSQIA